MASFQAQLKVGAAPQPATLWGLHYELTRQADFRNRITTAAMESRLILRLEAATNFAWANAWFQAAETHYPLEISFVSPQGMGATSLRLKAQQAYCVGVRLVNLPPAPGRETPPPMLEIEVSLGKQTAFDLGLEVVAGPGSDWQASYEWAGQGIFHWKQQQWPVEEYSYAVAQGSNTQGQPSSWPEGGRLRVRLPVMGLDSLLYNLSQKPRWMGDSQTGEQAYLEVTLGQGRVAYTMVLQKTNVLSWALEYGLSEQGHGTLGQIVVLAAQEEEVVQGTIRKYLTAQSPGDNVKPIIPVTTIELEEEKSDKNLPLKAEILANFDELAKLRIKEELPEYAWQPASTGTVAIGYFGGQRYHGFNSGIDKEHPKSTGEKRYDLSIEKRRELFEELREEGKMKDDNGDDLPNLGMAKFLSHAEANMLLKAKDAGIVFSKEETIFVDRSTCDSCRLYLGALCTKLGIQKLNVLYKKKPNDYTHLVINAF